MMRSGGFSSDPSGKYQSAGTSRSPIFSVERFTVTPLPGRAFGGPSITLSASEISPKTAVPMALITGGTSIWGDAVATACGCASIGVASVRSARFGANTVSRTFFNNRRSGDVSSGTKRSARLASVDSVSTASTASTGTGFSTGWVGRVLSTTILRSGPGVTAAMTLLTSFVTRWPDSGLTVVATFDWATVARSVTPVDLTTLVTASFTASLTVSIALAASRPNLGLSGVAESGLVESCLLSAGFADCDVFAPPSPSDSVWAEAVPAPSSIPAVTPAHTAPAPSQSKN